MSVVDAGTDSWVGRDLVDRQHRKLGRIEEIYLDEASGEPLWMVVRARRFGARHCFVPVAEAVSHDGAVMTPYDSRKIEGAPRLGTADGLPTDQVQVLYDHYSLGYVEPDDASCATTVERVLMYLR